MKIRVFVFRLIEQYLYPRLFDHSTVYTLQIYEPDSKADGYFFLYQLKDDGTKEWIKHGYLQTNHIDQIKQMIESIR